MIDSTDKWETQFCEDDSVGTLCLRPVSSYYSLSVAQLRTQSLHAET